MNRSFVIKGHMRTEEVVVSDKESGKSDGAIEAVETASRFDMMFKGSIETFNELFKRSEFF